MSEHEQAPEKQKAPSTAKSDLAGAAIAAAKGASAGGWVGAAKAAGVSLAQSNTGRKFIAGALVVLLVVTVAPAVAIFAAGVFASGAAGSDGTRTVTSVEGSGLTADDLAASQAAVAGTQIPWELHLAITRVSPPHAEDIDALAKALAGISSLGTGAVYDGAGGYLDGRTTSDQDNAAAEREAYVTALVGLGLTDQNAKRAYDMARQWRLGATETCDAEAAPIVVTLADGTEVTYTEAQSTNIRAMLGAIRDQEQPVLVAALIGTLTRTGALNVASNAEPDSLSYPNDEVRDAAGIGVFAADTGFGSVADRMSPRTQGEQFLSKLEAVEGWGALTPEAMAAAVLGEGDYAVHVSAAALVVEQLLEAQVTNCGGGLTGDVVLPLAPGTYKLTSGYGPRGRICFAGGCTNSFHKGQDFSAACGTPMYSASPGTVTHSGPYPSWGFAIMVTDALGVVHKYAHLPQNGLMVRVGDTVAAGQQIGVVGNTGMSTGCHLHFETWLDGIHMNPKLYLESFGLEL